MGRMHSRKRGKSKSTKPYRKEPPSWVEFSVKDIQKTVANLGKKGIGPSNIGVILRDQNGIPSVKLMTNKRVTTILKENKMTPELPEDLMNLIRNAVALDKHHTANPQDMTAKRGMQLAESKIKRLTKYYAREGKIPADWKYDLAKAKLLVR